MHSKKMKFTYFVIFMGFLFIFYNLILFMVDANSKETSIINILALFILFVFAILSAYKDNWNIMLMLFFVSLFNFQFSYIFFGPIMGYDFRVIPDYFGETVYSSFFEINKVIFYIGISVIIIFSIVTSYNSKNKKKAIKTKYFDINSEKIITVRKVSRILIFLTTPFAFIHLFKQIDYVLSYGYQAYFLSSSSEMGINQMISQFETLFRVSIAIYLASYPKIKELRIPIIIYVVYTLLYLGVGDRTNIAVLFMMLIWYFTEHKKRTYGNWRLPKFNFGNKFKLIIVGVSLLFIFSIWNEIRYSFGTGRSIQVSNEGLSTIVEFIVSQGRSFNTVLKAIKINETGILTFADKIIILFQPLIHQIEGMTSSVINFSSIHAIGGYMFNHVPSSADVISAFTNSRLYMSGAGLGSSFIAEGVLISGIFGVILTSIIVGIIISYASYDSNKNFWIHSFIIFSFIFIMRFPRDLTFGMFAFLIPFVIRAALIYFICILIRPNITRRKRDGKSIK